VVDDDGYHTKSGEQNVENLMKKIKKGRRVKKLREWKRILEINKVEKE
jgi:hypothetical protein